MSAPQTSNVLISTRSNQHLSAVGDPPRLTFVTGADQKQRIRETFLCCTSISETQMPPVMTITFSHEVKDHVYDVTARADGTVELLDHSSLPSTAFQDGRHFLISQEVENNVSYVVFKSVKFPVFQFVAVCQLNVGGKPEVMQVSDVYHIGETHEHGNLSLLPRQHSPTTDPSRCS